MSADNHIAILISTDGYRVIHCQALDNLVWWHTVGAGEHQHEQREEINPFVLWCYFSGAKVFKTREEAFAYAQTLYRKIGYVEYGICEVSYDKEFPKECPPCCEQPILEATAEDGGRTCINCGEYL